MFGKTVSAIMLSLLVISTLTLAFDIRPAFAQATVYINSDGSITPSSALISTLDNMTYTLEGDIGHLIVERNNIIIDGANHTVFSTINNYGILLNETSNVTVENMQVTSQLPLYRNIPLDGIRASSCSNVTIIGNTFTNCVVALTIANSTGTVFLNNSILISQTLLMGYISQLFSVIGLQLLYSIHNVIAQNHITECGYGIGLSSSSQNSIYHNTFQDNTEQITSNNSTNAWDNGYPSGGNYWSNYNGRDFFSGSYQNVTGSDGIGDTPYTIDVNNTDRYPLMTPFSSPSISDRLGLGAGFLEQLYNASTGLCRETAVEENEAFTTSNGITYQSYTNEIYWIASDNFLDSLALAPYNPAFSENISQTCSTYYNGSYFPYQTINGSNIPLTLHVANTYVLENTSDHIIALNLYNGTPLVDDNTTLYYPEFGDTLVYEALNYYVQGYPLDWCNNLFMEAYNMFDGKGVADSAFYNSSSTSYHEYANMKLALLVFGAKVLNLNVNLTGIEQELWSAQNMTAPEKGGIISAMNSSGQPVGTANGETTALTLLAYDNNLITQIRTERPNETKDSLNVTFPANNFNQTISITTNVTALPLLSDWAAIINNTIIWASPANNPRVAVGFFSSLDNKTNLSIQLIEYNDYSLDINIHNVTYPDGFTLASIKWSNPLTISLAADTLNVSSPSGTYVTSFPSFSLAYVTAGSTPLIGGTNESGICTGGEVDISVPAPHDVAVTNVTSSKTVVCQGFSANIAVTVENQGGYPETFDVTAYANATIIGSENVTLSAGNSTTVTFTWNSTGFAYGNYTLSAYAWPVLGETDTADNNFTGGWVIVSLASDITGPNGWPDGIVDKQDIATATAAFGSKPSFSNWNPNADINGDGVVNMRDIALVARQFGNHT